MLHAVNYVLNMKLMDKLRGTFSYKTDIGKLRKTNEDRAIVLRNANGDVLLAVCDGMGGYNHGDVAAQMTIDIIEKSFRKHDKFLNLLEVNSFIRKTLRKANLAVFKESLKRSADSHMGTTVTLAIIRNCTLVVANIGDSRAYIVDEDSHLLTEDDSYVNYLYQTGRITLEEMTLHPQRHILTKALGMHETVYFDIDHHRYNKNRILLCSDGLYTAVTKEEVLTILNTNDSVEEKCDLLIKTANRNGGFDNMSIALWEVSKNEN